MVGSWVCCCDAEGEEELAVSGRERERRSAVVGEEEKGERKREIKFRVFENN